MLTEAPNQCSVGVRSLLCPFLVSMKGTGREGHKLLYILVLLNTLFYCNLFLTYSDPEGR